jgi:hypothetical protein
MYAYVVCRLNIGYILTKLSQFSHCPAKVHYTCLHRICLYLRDTHFTGIVYWRPVPFSILPVGSFTPIPVKDETLPVFPSLSVPDQVVGFVDAAHATDAKTRRSVTGYVLTFCRAAVSYRSKVQNTIATSSTEAVSFNTVHVVVTSTLPCS